MVGAVCLRTTVGREGLAGGKFETQPTYWILRLNIHTADGRISQSME